VALLRVVVELINGANRRPHKRHAAVMCAALCGDYRNTGGDWSTTTSATHSLTHTATHTHQMQMQGQGQGQYQQQARYLHGQKAAADPIADDLRITFSDVRMTEYQDSGASASQHFTGGSGVFDVDHDDDESEFDVEQQAGGGHRQTETHADPDTLPHRPSSVFFKTPSFVRPSSVRRQSISPPPPSPSSSSPPPPSVQFPKVAGAVTTTSFVYTSNGDLLNSQAQKRTTSGLGNKDARLKRLSTTDYGLDQGVEKVDLDNLDDFNPSLSVVKDPLPGSVKEAGDDYNHCNHIITDSNIVQSEVVDSAKTSTSDYSNTGNTYAMADSNHESRLSMESVDSLYLDTQKHDDDILRLQREIEEIERQERAERESVGGGDTDSIMKHERELVRLRKEIADLDNEINSPKPSNDIPRQDSRSQPSVVATQRSYEFDNTQGMVGLCDENYSEGGYIDDEAEEKTALNQPYEGKDSGKSSALSFFNPFSKNKTKTKTVVKGKSTYEGAYNEGISVTGVKKEYHVDTEYSTATYDDNNSFMDEVPLVNQNTGSKDEWPETAQIVRKKSALANSAGGDKPKRQVTFHKSISTPTMVRQAGHFDDFMENESVSVETGDDRGGTVRPMIIKKASSLQSNARPSSSASSSSSSGRRLKVSSNSRAARKSNSKSPPRRQLSGEAEWNSYKGGQGGTRPGSTLKVGRSQNVRLSEANLLKETKGDGVPVHKPENLTYQEKRK
jgi:hypothetical protein